MAIPIEVKRKVKEEQAVVNYAQRLYKKLHDLVRSAHTSNNPNTKLSRLKVAIQNIQKIEELANRNKFIIISCVELSDQNILGNKILSNHYVFLNIYDLEPLETTINELWDDATQEIQNQFNAKQVAKKKIKDKLVQQKEFERQRLADIRAKEKARIEANKIKEKESEQKRKDKLAQQKELERQKLADIRAKEKARIEADKIKEKQAKKEINAKSAQQKELERLKITDERMREKAHIAAEKAAIKLAEKERKEKSRVALDKASIKAKRAETVAVSAILKDIFSEDMPVPPQVAVPDSTAVETSITGLDAESFTFMQALAAKQIWARDELEKLADHHSLMLDGTLDSINDASYDHFGGPFFEGDDPIEINSEFAKEITA